MSFAFEKVCEVLDFISSKRDLQPSLSEIAQAVGVSQFHLQRLFREWAGLSPTQFLHYLNVDEAKRRLANSESVFSTSINAGLSGPGRLHDQFIRITAMSPGAYRKAGLGVSLYFGFSNSEFGRVLIAWSNYGLVYLAFLDRDEEGIVDLQSRFPAVTFVQDDTQAAGWRDRVFQMEKLDLHLIGTPFQIQVWEALIRIPEGKVTSYSRLASAVGRPKASRAVGTAVGANPIAWLIPCHRVIREMGLTGEYRWGAIRKKAILLREWSSA